jgi:hypothetical protein
MSRLSLDARVGYLYDDFLLKHNEYSPDDNPGYVYIDTYHIPETPERIASIHSALAKTGILNRCVPLEFSAASPEIVKTVHTESHVERLVDLALDYKDIMNVRYM